MYEAFGRGDVPHVLAQIALDVHVFSFRDGKVCRNDNFHDTAQWVAALS